MLFLVSFIFLISFANSSITGNTNWKKCTDQYFCTRYRLLTFNAQFTHEIHGPLFSYEIDPQSIQIDNNKKITCTLNLQKKTKFLTNSLKLEVQIFQGGILHVLIDPIEDEEIQGSRRFRISDYDGVSWDQLIRDEKVYVTTNNEGINIQFGNQIEQDSYFPHQKVQTDKIEINLKYAPFRMSYKINGQEMIEVNSRDLLFMENSKIHQHSSDYVIQQNESFENLYQNDIFEPFIDSLMPKHKEAFYTNQNNNDDQLFYDFKQSVGLSFKFNTPYLYGLPERANKVLLEVTENSQPYRLYNIDIFQHQPYSNQNLYGSIPYITAHSPKYDVSLLWMNSAETFIDILKYQMETEDKEINEEYEDDLQQKERLVTWLSESGKLEFFIFGTSIQGKNSLRGPRYIYKILSTITGFPPLPPYFALGFHYSKWESLSTEKLLHNYQAFDEKEIPVDTFWIDIDYTKDNKYFEFDIDRFQSIDKYVDVITKSYKNLVIITDPHIKVDSDYFVYKEGLTQEIVKDKDGFSEFGVFIRNSDMKSNFVGDCWPKESVWVDFLNKNSAEFWKSLYLPTRFLGTNGLYNFWIDMNEPSVFSGDELTLDKKAIHITENGLKFQHKDLHNAYGILMAKATYDGILQRNIKASYDNKVLRPFLLSRSVFAGSQKYGAMWTGDNQASFDFLKLSVQMCLSMSISGFSFCGADIGGFTGFAHPDLLVKWYQAAIFQPFMRAHAHNTVNNREPFHLPEHHFSAVKIYLYFRQAMLPYLYTQFAITSKTGYPIMRPLWNEYPQDDKTFSIESQYLFGESLMVCPSMDMTYQIQAYLPPQDNWYFYLTYELQKKSDKIQYIYLERGDIGLFVKAGSILPKKFIKRSSSLQTLTDPYVLEIFLSPINNKAQGQLYLDDGLTYDFIEKNQSSLVEFEFTSNYELKINFVWNNFKLGEVLYIAGINIIGIKEQFEKIQVKDEDDEWMTLQPASYLYSKQQNLIRIRDLKIYMLKAKNKSTVLKVINERTKIQEYEQEEEYRNEDL